MGLFGWWKGRSSKDGSGRLRDWRNAWSAAVDAADPSTEIQPLEQSLRDLGLSSDDVEIEEEMLEGLRALAHLTGRLAQGTLPAVDTGHRVVGSDTCHFSAPASAPDDAAQASGRVFLTSHRALFTGGGRSVAIAWHRVGDVLRVDRDVLVVVHAGATAHRFRFNSFADAVCATALARRLSSRVRDRSTAL